ncbi:hypothetical protein [Dyadobacter sp. CY312]|uniref:hypothetical protein n=1 Tax=Dyadobacter sp. CY312 TaxID=2907303 RepID=UPI001F2E5C4F|nr:hypothetical protein [Dyadobacter sp. CY312]MCE7038818.1 hypothetical protein [Dyadobacter sp. CY312]
MFKKKNLVARLWLKHTDRIKYKQYKWELANHKHVEFANFISNAEKLTTPGKIIEYAKKNGRIRLCHSGNAGDVIYALPTIRQIKALTNVPVELYLRLGQPLKLSGYNTHPLGNVMLNEKMADMLMALLRPQPYIDLCEILTDQTIDIDLDYFRSGGVPLDKGNIARWCSYLTGVNPILWTPWVTVEPNKFYADTIVMARSERYRNFTVNYKFLNDYQNIVFIGVESEYKDIKKTIPHIKWVQVSNFLEMAQIIAGSKFFIGNQSFPFSIAESLKVPRILETSFEVINVIPEGENGYDFFFQEHLESIVEMLDKK